MKTAESNRLSCFHINLSLNSSASVAACELFDLGDAYAVEVALDRVLESGCRNCEFDGSLCGLSGEQGIDKTCAEGVTAANAVNDVEVVGLREAILLTVV